VARESLTKNPNVSKKVFGEKPIILERRNNFVSE